MKKRIIALILSVGLLLSCLPITTIAESSAMVVAENYTATQGSYAYVYLRADNFVDVATLDIEIYYDSSAMSIDYTSNGAFLNSAQVSTNTTTSGVIKISAMALNGLTSGTSSSGNRIMTIRFKINEDCPVGDYPVVVTVGDAYDNDLNPTSISGVNGVISVKQATAKSFPVYTTLSNTSVEKGDEFTLQAYHSSPSSYKFASATFTVEYDHKLLEIKSIELDSELLVEGAVHSINSSNPGMAIISYASTNEITCTNLFKITFEVVAEDYAQASVKIIADDVYDEDLTVYSPYTATSSTILINEKYALPDYPDLRLEAEKFVVGKPAEAYVVLEGNSKVAAADFAIEYDKNIFTVNSVTADSDALSKGAMIVVNNNFSDGQIRFSYVKQNGDFAEDTKLIKISLTLIDTPSEHYTLTPTGTDVCDINFKDITLDYIAASDCVFTPTIVKPTCTEAGYTLNSCVCGESYTSDPTPSLGGYHDYGDWIFITEPSCIEPGSKYKKCSICDDVVTEHIDAYWHRYSDWYLTTEPTCTEWGVAEKRCELCGEVKAFFVEELLDSYTYPESKHNYGNKVSETYNFSYEDAESLKFTFSSSTFTELNYDYIYIYDATGKLYGKYTGSQLAGKTISVEGNSFSIKLISDDSKSYYGFSLDSIVAINKDDLIRPFGHNYSEEWTVDTSPNCTEEGSKSHHCTVCGDKTDITAIEANGHSYGDWIVSDEPTCTVKGSRYKECSACGDIVTEAIKANGHNYSEEWTIDVPATCTEKGSKSRHCLACDNKTNITVINATGHSYSTEWTIDVEPTCTENGSKSHHCTVCDKKNNVTTIVPTGHSYGDWTIDLEPTCTAEGIKSHHCISCDYKTDVTSVAKIEHKYGDWIIDIESTCTEKGSAHKICGECGHTYTTPGEILLYSQTYPESSHNYGNNISEVYNFSYPDAITLTLTFSSSTMTESKRDFIYIYDANGNLYGKYSGGALAGRTITLEGDSFRIELTSDGSVGKYGFSLTSIVAVVENEVIALKEHDYQIANIMDNHPHNVTYCCSVCGDEYTEPSADLNCLECVPIVGLESTHVDYDKMLIFTSLQECYDINELLGISEASTVTIDASHKLGDNELYGTGTVISVFVGNERIGTFTLIVEGDVTGDSVCDIIDCAQVSLATRGFKTLDDIYSLAADSNSDDIIDVDDYQAIINKALAS